MGVRQLPRIAEQLIAHGRPAAEPAGIVERGTLPSQRSLLATLATLPARAAEAGIRAPAITLVGEVAALRDELGWFEHRPLSGRSVVVTRARAQASALAARLRELGATSSRRRRSAPSRSTPACPTRAVRPDLRDVAQRRRAPARGGRGRPRARRPDHRGDRPGDGARAARRRHRRRPRARARGGRGRSSRRSATCPFDARSSRAPRRAATCCPTPCASAASRSTWSRSTAPWPSRSTRHARRGARGGLRDVHRLAPRSSRGTCRGGRGRREARCASDRPHASWRPIGGPPTTSRSWARHGPRTPRSASGPTSRARPGRGSVSPPAPVGARRADHGEGSIAAFSLLAHTLRDHVPLRLRARGRLRRRLPRGHGGRSRRGARRRPRPRRRPSRRPDRRAAPAPRAAVRAARRAPRRHRPGGRRAAPRRRAAVPTTTGCSSGPTTGCCSPAAERFGGVAEAVEISALTAPPAAGVGDVPRPRPVRARSPRRSRRARRSPRRRRRSRPPSSSRSSCRRRADRGGRDRRPRAGDRPLRQRDARRAARPAVRSGLRLGHKVVGRRGRGARRAVRARRSPTSSRASCCSTRTRTGRWRWRSTAAVGGRPAASARRRGAPAARRAMIGTPAAASAGDRLDEPPRAGARDGRRAARDAGHGGRADRGARAPGPHVERARRAARCSCRSSSAIRRAAPAARRRSRSPRPPARRRGSSGPTTCWSTGARSRASSSRGARRRAGRSSASGSTSRCGRRTSPGAARPCGTLGREPRDVDRVLGDLLADLEVRLARAAGEMLADWRARDALRGREITLERAAPGSPRASTTPGALLVRTANGETRHARRRRGPPRARRTLRRGAWSFSRASRVGYARRRWRDSSSAGVGAPACGAGAWVSSSAACSSPATALDLRARRRGLRGACASGCGGSSAAASSAAVVGRRLRAALRRGLGFGGLGRGRRWSVSAVGAAVARRRRRRLRRSPRRTSSAALGARPCGGAGGSAPSGAAARRARRRGRRRPPRRPRGASSAPSEPRSRSASSDSCSASSSGARRRRLRRRARARTAAAARLHRLDRHRRRRLARPSCPSCAAAPAAALALREVAQQLARQRRRLAGHPGARAAQDLLGLGGVRRAPRRAAPPPAAGPACARPGRAAARCARGRRRDEFTSRPSSRLVSGQRWTAYSSCSSRVNSANAQIHALAWSRRPIRFSASAWSTTLTPSRFSSRGQPPIISIARSNASASRDAAISCSARRRSCGFLLRSTAVSRNARLSSPPSSKCSIARARRQPAGATRAPASAAHWICSPQSRCSTAIRHSSRSKTSIRRFSSAATGSTRRSTRRRRPRPRRTGPDDDRAAAVDVAVEQRVQRDDRVVVLGRRVDEVDDDARLLARLAARDAADALLVDALGRRRGEVHADRRARRVPALGEQLRVDEHVDVAALVAARIRASSRFGVSPDTPFALMPDVAERLGDVVGVAHAGGVDDAGHAVEARLVEVGDREVERQLIQQLGQHLLVELGVDLAAAQRHLGDRAHARPGRDPHAAQRRDDAAARGLREVEARGLRREEVGDVAGDQRAGRGHADEDRAGPGADRRRGLLAQRGVGLVADDDRVGVGDVAGVADEPLVGLDGDRAVAPGPCRPAAPGEIRLP